jgi:hypothetical protein
MDETKKPLVVKLTVHQANFLMTILQNIFLMTILQNIMDAGDDKSVWRDSFNIHKKLVAAEIAAREEGKGGDK